MSWTCYLSINKLLHTHLYHSIGCKISNVRLSLHTFNTGVNILIIWLISLTYKCYKGTKCYGIKLTNDRFQTFKMNLNYKYFFTTKMFNTIRLGKIFGNFCLDFIWWLNLSKLFVTPLDQKILQKYRFQFKIKT
jgi:hypothetical protein